MQGARSATGSFREQSLRGKRPAGCTGLYHRRAREHSPVARFFSGTRLVVRSRCAGRPVTRASPRGGLQGLVQVGWAYRRFQEGLTRQLGDALRHRRVAVYGSGLSGQLLGTTLEALGATLVAVVDGNPARHGAMVCGVPVEPVDALRRPRLAIDAVVIAASLPAASDAMRVTVRRLLGPGVAVWALTDLAYDGDGISIPGDDWPVADSSTIAPQPLASDLRWMRRAARRHPLDVHFRVELSGDGPGGRQSLAALRAQWHRGWSVAGADGSVRAAGQRARAVPPACILSVSCSAGTVLPAWALYEWAVQATLWPSRLPLTVAIPVAADDGGPATRTVTIGREGRPAAGRQPVVPLSFGTVHDPEARRVRVAGRRALPVVFSRAPLVLVDPDSIRRILIIKVDHVGDVVLSLPVITDVRRRFPRADITVVTASWTTALLEEVLVGRGVVDRVVTLDLFHEVSGQGRRPADSELAARVQAVLGTMPFDVAIDLRRPADARDVLQAVTARVKVAFGDEDAFAQIGLPAYGMKARTHVPVHTVDQLHLLVDAALGRQPFEVAASLPAPVAPTRRFPAALHRRRWIVAVAPGSGDQLRMWPAASYAGLVGRLVKELGAGVALVGSPAEASLMEQVIGALPSPRHVVSLAGRLSLTDFRAAVREADLFVGNTTGPTHIAAASGVPTLNIFSGQVSAFEWAPRGPEAFVLWTRPSCAPCYLPSGACPFSRTCLTSITPDQAFDAVRRILLACYGTVRQAPRRA